MVPFVQSYLHISALAQTLPSQQYPDKKEVDPISLILIIFVCQNQPLVRMPVSETESGRLNEWIRWVCMCARIFFCPTEEGIAKEKKGKRSRGLVHERDMTTIAP